MATRKKAPTRKTAAKKGTSKKRAVSKKPLVKKGVAKKSTTRKKAGGGSAAGRRTREVDQWFAKQRHPQEETMLAVRDAILAADPRISECIKWSTPTFVFEGNLASFQPNARRFASLMFHHGAQIPGRHPVLQGSAKQVRTLSFDDPRDVRGKRAALAAVVRAWCDWKAGA